MMTEHVSEADIQLYVTEPELLDANQKVHMQTCARCQAQAANYTLLFKSIQESPKPAFNFDLSALVMDQLPAPKRSFPWAAVWIALLSIAAVGVSVVLFWSSAIAVIKSASLILLAAAATGAVVVLVFQAMEMLAAHHKQMSLLVKSKTLQL